MSHPGGGGGTGPGGGGGTGPGRSAPATGDTQPRRPTYPAPSPRALPTPTPAENAVHYAGLR